MATFSDDFSAASGTATVSDPTAISGWTGQFPTGSAAFVSASIVTDAGAIGGKIMRLQDTGWGADNKSIYPTAIGALGSGVETEILVSWRLDSGITSIATTAAYAPGYIRQSTTNIGRRYQVGLTKSGATENLRLWYVQNADEWVSIGAAYDVSTPYILGDWWWTRLRVSAAGEWLWRSWKDGDSEPGSWQNAGVTETTVTAGYCGVGMYANSANEEIDIQWFSVGTDGDSPPAPSGGASNVLMGQCCT